MEGGETWTKTLTVHLCTNSGGKLSLLEEGHRGNSIEKARFVRRKN